MSHTSVLMRGSTFLFVVRAQKRRWRMPYGAAIPLDRAASLPPKPGNRRQLRSGEF
jgi:hypothetical protein